MSKRIIWRSWSKLEASYELSRMKNLPLRNLWLNGHEVLPTPNDIFFTTNGYDHQRGGAAKRVTWYAESYQYLKSEYDRYQSDTRWNHRFHFNPNFTTQPNTSLINIAGFWQHELALFEETIKNKKPEFTFGMVLGKKPPKKMPCDFGYFRTEVIEKSKGRSFGYYGCNWERSDPNYKGEVYVNGNRNSPAKFQDARILMTKAKFVWVLENIHDQFYAQNYMTEKIFHAFLSASIPIYAGCWNIEELVGTGLVIDLRNHAYNIPAVLDYCEKMPESEYQGYLDRIATFLRGPGKRFSYDERFVELDNKLGSLFG